ALAIGGEFQLLAGCGLDKEMKNAPGAVAVDAVADSVSIAAAIADHHAFGMNIAARGRKIQMFEPFSFQRTPAGDSGEKGAKHSQATGLRSACRERRRCRPYGWRSPIHCRTTTGYEPWCRP